MSVTTTRRFALALGVLAVANGASASAAPPQAETQTPPHSAPQPAPAVISALEGPAVVSVDNDVTPALAGMKLYPPNRIFVLDGSKVTLQFDDGCEREVIGGAVLTITAGDGCAAAGIERSAQAVADPTGVSPQSSFAAAAGAPGTAGALLLPGAGAGVGAGAAAGSTGLLIGGAFATGGLIWAFTNDDDDDPPRSTQPPISPQ